MFKKFLLSLFFITPIFCHASPLDEYLSSHGFKQIEGHSCLGNTTQPEYFLDLIAENPQIKVIGEIGFNGGHSSELFLMAREDTFVYSFDIMKHPYVLYGKRYIDTNYPNRHLLIEGNSLIALPDYHDKNPDLVFDLIFIDGGHSHEVALLDIRNMKNFAHEDTLLIIDDLRFPQVIKAWEKCIDEGIISHIKTHQSKHKIWGECRYLFSE